MKVKIKCPHCDSDITKYPGHFYICPLCRGIIDPRFYKQTTKYTDPSGEKYKEYIPDKETWEQMVARHKKIWLKGKLNSVNHRVMYLIALIFGVIGLISMATAKIFASANVLANIIATIVFILAIVGTVYFVHYLITNKQEYFYKPLFYTNEEENETVAIRYFVSPEYFCFAKILAYSNERENPPNIHFVEMKRSSVSNAYYLKTETWYVYRFGYINEQGKYKNCQIPVIFSEAQIKELFPIQEIDKSSIMRKKYDVKKKKIVRFWKL